ncbi:hypothetical protein T01_10393 [Trichinella spiralis]|uniref:Uncharacterized protein n=1 Tax=Trichinella spiralis TaxID=6334 RepID=A0A0V1AUA9_TRISP|nr:hypothetical protein T01_15564 [Trichinella spiralis]KRY27884.1 hypothetical protein T01_10393 [Trichinella spiralis]
MTLYVNLIKTNIMDLFKSYWFQPEDQCLSLLSESVKSVIHIPTDLKFVEYATVGDELQFTYLFSDSEITASTAKPNDIPNNSSGNNCDSEEIKESPVSMNVRASLRKFSCCTKENIQ